MKTATNRFGRAARAEAPIRTRFDVYRDLRTVEDAFKRAALLGAMLIAFGFGLGVASASWAASQPQGLASPTSRSAASQLQA
jgi:hypothetical protein